MVVVGSWVVGTEVVEAIVVTGAGVVVGDGANEAAGVAVVEGVDGVAASVVIISGTK